VKSASTGRSSFYTIGACAAMCILMVQAILNVFGTVDFLPLTGVTFPFVSNGGSSMISAWGLLAFIKAADTRQNASFAVRLSGQTRVTAEEDAA
jgi:cell division protein FtsW (lipid II flippase)